MAMRTGVPDEQLLFVGVGSGASGMAKPSVSVHQSPASQPYKAAREIPPAASGSRNLSHPSRYASHNASQAEAQSLLAIFHRGRPVLPTTRKLLPRLLLPPLFETRHPQHELRVRRIKLQVHTPVDS